MGITANSIRVGNYVKYCNSKTTEVRLEGIAPAGCDYVCAFNGVIAPVQSFEGIRLSADWFYSCNFMEYADNDFVIPALPQVVFRLKEQSVGVIVNDVEIKNITFLHELQNLFFILSGNELTVRKEMSYN